MSKHELIINMTGEGRKTINRTRRNANGKTKTNDDNNIAIRTRTMLNECDAETYKEASRNTSY